MSYPPFPDQKIENVTSALLDGTLLKMFDVFRRSGFQYVYIGKFYAPFDTPLALAAKNLEDVDLTGLPSCAEE